MGYICPSDLSDLNRLKIITMPIRIRNSSPQVCIRNLPIPTCVLTHEWLTRLRTAILPSVVEKKEVENTFWSFNLGHRNSPCSSVSREEASINYSPFRSSHQKAIKSLWSSNYPASKKLEAAIISEVKIKPAIFLISFNDCALLQCSNSSLV